MIQRLLVTIILTCLAIPAIAGVDIPHKNQGSVSVLHWWTSPSEAAAAEVIKKNYLETGYNWIDQAIEGGGGGKAMTVLKSQVISGNPPPTAQISGLGIQNWASLDLLVPVHNAARRHEWDEHLPSFVSEAMKYNGLYYGVPVSIHRNNWLWINPKVFESTGLAIPTSWNDLIAIAPRLRRAGYIPLTHGGEPWQQATIFESVLLAEGGSDFYRRVLIDHEEEALNSPTLKRAFRKLRQLTSLQPEGSNRQSWDQATKTVINNKAAMILMGDWALGELSQHNLHVDKDFICRPAFGTEGSFVYNIDSFVMFNIYRFKDRQAQYRLSNVLMDKDLQIAFSDKKGSIPVRMDAVDHLQGCQKKSWEDLQYSIAHDTLVPSIIHGMPIKESQQTALINLLSRYIADPSITPEEAVKSMSSALLARAK